MSGAGRTPRVWPKGMVVGVQTQDRLFDRYQDLTTSFIYLPSTSFGSYLLQNWLSRKCLSCRSLASTSSTVISLIILCLRWFVCQVTGWFVTVLLDCWVTVMGQSPVCTTWSLFSTMSLQAHWTSPGEDKAVELFLVAVTSDNSLFSHSGSEVEVTEVSAESVRDDNTDPAVTGSDEGNDESDTWDEKDEVSGEVAVHLIDSDVPWWVHIPFTDGSLYWVSFVSSIPFSGRESPTATNPDSSSFVKTLAGQIRYSEKHMLYRLLRDMNAQVISIILDKT